MLIVVPHGSHVLANERDKLGWQLLGTARWGLTLDYRFYVLEMFVLCTRVYHYEIPHSQEHRSRDTSILSPYVYRTPGMILHRVNALQPQHTNDREKRKRKKERNIHLEAIEWIGKEATRTKIYTKFAFPIDRFKFCYNLKRSVFEDVRNSYLKGTIGDNANETTSTLRPKTRATMRQDIFALILISKFNLCKCDFIWAKRLATSRNLGHS